MRFREYVAEQTIALVAAQAQAIMLARMADWPELEETPKINYSELVWGAVLVAQRLEQSGLAPWVSSDKGSHINATQALEFLRDKIAKETEEKQEEPVGDELSEEEVEKLKKSTKELEQIIADEMLDNSDEYVEPKEVQFESPTPLDLGKS